MLSSSSLISFRCSRRPRVRTADSKLELLPLVFQERGALVIDVFAVFRLRANARPSPSAEIAVEFAPSRTCHVLPLRTKAAHFLSKVDICCLCAKRLCFVLLQIVCFCFPAEPSRAVASLPQRAKKKKIIVNVLGHLKKPVVFCFCALCSVFTSCLRAAHFGLTEPCVPRSSVAVLDEFFVVFF